MPLVEPGNLREKILEVGGPGAGKTTDHLTIAWWAFHSGDKRKFFILDTDDEAVLQVMNESKYDGMLHSVNGEIVNEGGNVLIFSAYEWDEYRRFSDYDTIKFGKDRCVIQDAKPGDWIVLDFVTHAWSASQEGFLHDAVQKSRGRAMYEAGKEGLTGWDMFRTEFNWNAINGSYFDFIKPILLMTKAHIFMTSELKVIDENTKNPDDREHLAQFGKYAFIGQKKLGHQCRSYLRKQRLARGRVLFTNGKDRARKELNGDDCSDFMLNYLRDVAGWKITDPE